jgi:hypothetical protein
MSLFGVSGWFNRGLNQFVAVVPFGAGE